MSIKARSKSIGIKKVSQYIDEEAITGGVGVDVDGVVMVMFPMETWMKVTEMSNRLNIESAAVISVALEMLDEKMEANDDS